MKYSPRLLKQIIHPLSIICCLLVLIKFDYFFILLAIAPSVILEFCLPGNPEEDHWT